VSVWVKRVASSQLILKCESIYVEAGLAPDFVQLTLPLSLNIARDTLSLEAIFDIVSCSKITTLCAATRDFTNYFLLFTLSLQK